MDYTPQRREELEKHIRDDLKLRVEYEDKLRLADDPKERSRCQDAIARLKNQIAEWQQELADLEAAQCETEQQPQVSSTFPTVPPSQPRKPVPAPTTLPTPQPVESEQLPLVEIVTPTGKRERGYLLRILRDPLWQGIGAIIAILALAVTIVSLRHGATATATATPTLSATLLPTATATSSPTSTPTPTPIPSHTPTATPSPTATPILLPTATPFGFLFNFECSTQEWWAAVGGTAGWGKNEKATSVSFTSAATFVSEGKCSLQSNFDGGGTNGEYKATFYGAALPLKDWNAFSSLKFDVYNPLDNNVPVTVTIALATGAESCWNESTRWTPLRPGLNYLTFPLNTADYKRCPNWDIGKIRDRDNVRRLHLIFLLNKPLAGTVYIDNVRLEK